LTQKSKFIPGILLGEFVENIRESLGEGSLIVLCHGVFDLVHPGHIEHLKQAKEFGHVLIVSITGDEYVNKGPGRPFFSESQRSHFVSQLEMVDFVVVSHSPSSVGIIKAIKPDVYVKGEEYSDFEKDDTQKIVLEKEVVESLGGEIKFTTGFRASSTSLLNLSRISMNPEQANWVARVKEKFTLEEILSWLEKLNDVKPIILGEVIIDEYTSCEALGRTSKYPLLAFQKLETKRFPGGSLAIADICSHLCGQTNLVTAIPEDDKLLNEVLHGMSPKFEVLGPKEEKLKLVVKHRFYDLGTSSRVFEYYEFDPRNFKSSSYQVMNHQIKNTEQPLIIADFGHGFFSTEFIKGLCENNSFLCVNTQANAGNRGFNTISKYKRADFIALNGGELELEFREKNLNYTSIVPEIMKRMSANYAIVTLGKKGLIVFGREAQYHEVPILSDRVVDIVGAGDAVFSVASLLAYLHAPLEVIGVAAAVCAAHEISKLGHSRPLSNVDLKRHVKGIFG